MADRWEFGIEAVKAAQFWLPAAAAAYLSVVGAKTHKRAKEAAIETKAGNAVVADVAAKVDAIAAQTGAGSAGDTCEAFTRLKAENASLKAEIERLKAQS